MASTLNSAYRGVAFVELRSDASGCETTLQFVSGPTAEELRAEAEAWREIAMNVARRGLLGVGLCREILEAEWRGLHFYITDAMRHRVRLHLAMTGHSTIRCQDEGWVAPNVHRDVRVLAALFLALEAEDEAHALNSKRSRPAKAAVQKAGRAKNARSTRGTR